MAHIRPLVSVYDSDKAKYSSSILMPSVFCSPLRPDLIRFVHTNMAKNNRQPYAVSANAGYQTSAESWGTGRAVSRIPRVPGGGTHRAGQGAFGNMCRGGGMFCPTKTWRRWHRKTNLTQKRHAVASAIAATGIPSLVMARGHRIDKVLELPLVVTDKIQDIKKTKDAVKLLSRLGIQEDLEKVKNSKKLHSGKGKSRNRRYTMRRGPLIIYKEDNGVTKAFRNIPGVDFCHVDRLNLLQLAPGGSMGRLCVWSSSAFKRLQDIYGRHDGSGTAPLKKGYHLPRSMMQNADLARIITSEEVQSVIRPIKKRLRIKTEIRNPLKNRNIMQRLNPAAAILKRKARLAQKKGSKEYKKVQAEKAVRKTMKKKINKTKKNYFKEITLMFDEKKRQEEEKIKALKAAHKAAIESAEQ